MQKTSPVSPALSLYLDIVRFAAALAVLADHLLSYPISGAGGPRGGWQAIGNYGTTAVTLFFVLSGYVIAFVVTARERDGWNYATSRIARLYSVVLPALLLTWLCDRIGQSIDPAFYAHPKIWMKPPSAEGYVSSFFFVNEYRLFAFGGIAPGSNAPFWSLSFEATYYLAAGLLIFLRRTIAVPLALILLAAAGPTIAILFPLWLIGYALFIWREPLAARIRWPAATWALSGLAILLVPLLLDPVTGQSFGLVFPFGRGELPRDIGKDFATALAFAVHITSAKSLFDRHPAWLAKRPKIIGVIRFSGATTFPLYAVHFPVLALAGAASPFERTSPAHLLWLLAVTAIAAMLLTPLCDALKIRMKVALTLPARASGGRGMGPGTDV